MGEDVVVSWSALKRYYQEILRGRESGSGAGRCSCVLKSCIHGKDRKKGGYCVKSSTAASPLARLESPVGEGGLVPYGHHTEGQTTLYPQMSRIPSLQSSATCLAASNTGACRQGAMKYMIPSCL